jgi:hypothetical protein
LGVSYETGQVWAFHLGARDGDAAGALMEQFFARLPQELVHRVLIYTDGYASYAPAIEEQLQKRDRGAWSDRVHRCRPKKERRIKGRRRQGPQATSDQHKARPEGQTGAARSGFGGHKHRRRRQQRLASPLCSPRQALPSLRSQTRLVSASTPLAPSPQKQTHLR